MERFEQEILAAKKSIGVADHLINVTFKLVSEPKLLLTAVERISEASQHAAASVCHKEALYKQIPLFKDSEMWKAFKSHAAKKHKVRKEHIDLCDELLGIIEQHKESAVEFRKDGKLVICSETYKMKIVDINSAKQYLEKAKVFIKEMENLTLNGRTP
jgi:hypothetical protein